MSQLERFAAGRDLARWLGSFPPNQRLVVGCSGGLDSLTLALALSQLAAHRVRAVHIHHGLHPDADHWAAHTTAVLGQWGVPIVTQYVQVPTGNIEAMARQVRREALAGALQAHEILVLAHHQRDQAETVILRAMRGSGVRGMAAMREPALWGKQSIHRPWLHTARDSIHELACLLQRQRSFEWVCDPANEDLRFDRAWLRRMWPSIETRWPQAVASLAHVADRMAEADEVLTELAQADLTSCRGGEAEVNIQRVQRLSRGRQRLMLREWLQNLGWNQPPASSHIDQLVRLIREPSTRFEAGEWRFFVSNGRLNAVNRSDLCNVTRSTHLMLGKPLNPRWRVVQAEYGLPLELLGQPLELRARRGGERIRLAGRDHHSAVKKLVQAERIDRWVRDQVQLLWSSSPEQLLAVIAPKSVWLNVDSGWVKNGWCLERIDSSDH